MKATFVLKEEHRVIERVLAALQRAVERLEQGTKMDMSFFTDAADFIAGFADGCHHRKEEGVLFEAMLGAGLPRTGGPIAVMRAEHEQARAYTRGMREAAARFQAGEQEALPELIQNARAYVALLRDHIAKEDNVLFPMAEGLIPEPEQSKLVAEFARIEHEETGEGVHEKYLALAERLERLVSG